MLKICSQCKIEKDVDGFYPRKNKKDGLRSECKDCCSLNRKQQYSKNAKKAKADRRAFHAKNTEAENEISRIWHKNNPERAKFLCKKWRIENSEKDKERKKQWHIENAGRLALDYLKRREEDLPRCLEIGRKAARKRISTPKGKLSNSVSTGIYQSIKRGTKNNRHWESLVDFTIDQLRQHLEKIFTPEMSWDNYGTYWHIDHKAPIAAFNFERPEDVDFRICWSIKNLQPLEAIKNKKKSAKVDEEFLQQLRASM